MMGNGKGYSLRPSTGPAYHSTERADYERTLLARLIEDVMGDHPRAGLESIVSLMATGGWV